MKKLTILFALFAFSVSSYAQIQWKADPFHSSLNFKIKHSNISMVNGKFMDYTGNLTTTDTTLDNAQFDFTIQATSINTNVDARDNHLRSADFFEVEKYPTITFKSKEIKKTGEDKYSLHGKLTIKDVTKDVVFDLKYGGHLKTDKEERIGITAKAVIDRFDYNIEFDPSGMGVGKDVHIVVYSELVKQ